MDNTRVHSLPLFDYFAVDYETLVHFFYSFTNDFLYDLLVSDIKNCLEKKFAGKNHHNDY